MRTNKHGVEILDPPKSYQVTEREQRLEETNAKWDEIIKEQQARRSQFTSRVIYRVRE